MRDANFKPDEQEEKPAEAPNITRNKREFTALIRTEIFRFLRPLSVENYAAAVATVSGTCTAESSASFMEPYYTVHERIRLDNEARNGRHTYVEPNADNTSWRICQVLIDPEELNDRQAEFTVDLAQAREEGKPTLTLLTVRRIE